MLSIQEADEHLLREWDRLVDTSINGTLFHKQRFLAYHKERFSGKERYCFILNGEEPWAQISLTVEEVNGKVVAKSPYGGSYGGFIFQSYPTYSIGNELVSKFIQYLQKHNVEQFRIIFPIACCSEYPLDTFYFNLLENGFRSTNRDISSVFYFDKGTTVIDNISKRARNATRKAEKLGLNIQRNPDLKDFWYLMEKTFDKHGAKPTHTYNEFEHLLDLTPDSVYYDIAYLNTTPIAGIAYFTINRRVNSSFYFCQDPLYQHYQALSYLLLNALQDSRDKGYLYFDFGTSTINMKARENIFAFKEGFSKTGLFRETFEWQSMI